MNYDRETKYYNLVTYKSKKYLHFMKFHTLLEKML